MKLNEIKTFFDYNFWAFERTWECIAQLSNDQFIEDIDYSTGSIRNIVIHMMSSTNRWMDRLQNIDASPQLKFDEFDTLVKTKQKWDELKNKVLQYVYSLDPEKLDQTVHWELPARALKLDNPRWEILLHVANHATDHRAQILAILHRHFHVKTVEQDMILYLSERN